MTQNRTSIDPYRPSTGYYECLNCSFRRVSVERIRTCPKCHGEVHNIAVPRE